MSITPDLEALLGQHGAFLVGLEFYAHESTAGPTLTQVIEFLDARQIIAGVGTGPNYGSKASVVANIAAMQDDTTVVVASANGTLGRGQDAGEFFAGLAYALQCRVVVDEETMVLPNGDIIEASDREEALYSSGSLSLYRSTSPLTALATLINAPEPGQYGQVGKYLMVCPDPSFQLRPPLLSTVANALPLITFEKTGRVRSLWLGNSTEQEYTVLVNCGPTYTPVGRGPKDSPVAQVRAGLSQIPLVIVDDEQIARGEQAKPKKFAGRDQLASLLDQAPRLNQCDPGEFFVEAARVLGLGPEVERVVADFEAIPVVLPDPDNPKVPAAVGHREAPIYSPGATSLAGFPLTTVDGPGFSTVSGIATTTVLAMLLKQVPDGDLTKLKWWQRSRWTPVSLIGFTALLGAGFLFALATAVSGSFAGLIGADSGSRILAGVTVLALSFGLFGQIMAIKGIGPARRLLAQARADGVLS